MNNRTHNTTDITINKTDYYTFFLTKITIAIKDSWHNRSKVKLLCKIFLLSRYIVKSVPTSFRHGLEI